MTKKVDLSKLSQEELDSLEQELEARKRAKINLRESEITNYKELVKRTVGEQVISLQKISTMLSQSKADIFNTFITIIQMKHELFKVKNGQQSHTFSDDNGNQIKIGYRILDRYDDTLDEGIAFIHKYIESKAVDVKTSELVKKLYRLLKKDAKGNLKPSRVIELQNMAEEEDDENLKRGVEIIRKSYKPERSTMFIESETLNNAGKKQSIPLSITSADFPEGANVDFDLFDCIEKKTEINLCESCKKLEDFPACLPDEENVVFGTGKSNDNIIKCSDYKPVTNNEHV